MSTNPLEIVFYYEQDKGLAHWSEIDSDSIRGEYTFEADLPGQIMPASSGRVVVTGDTLPAIETPHSQTLHETFEQRLAEHRFRFRDYAASLKLTQAASRADYESRLAQAWERANDR